MKHGTEGLLLVVNNETGFGPEHVNAICNVRTSTKANQKDQGYIGEKGVGFKSVFMVGGITLFLFTIRLHLLPISFLAGIILPSMRNAIQKQDYLI